jgi:hypothetical protein
VPIQSIFLAGGFWSGQLKELVSSQDDHFGRDDFRFRDGDRRGGNRCLIRCGTCLIDRLGRSFHQRFSRVQATLEFAHFY